MVLKTTIREGEGLTTSGNLGNDASWSSRVDGPGAFNCLLAGKPSTNLWLQSPKGLLNTPYE